MSDRDAVTYVELIGGPSDGEVYAWPADCFYMRVHSFPGLDPGAKPTDLIPRPRQYEYRDTLRLSPEGRRIFTVGSVR